MKTTTFAVSGMKCAHCKANVENALGALTGVKMASVDLEKGEATVEYDEAAVSSQQMKEAVAQSGHYTAEL